MRESLDINDEDKIYFESLETLLNKNGKIIQLISLISNNQSNFLRERVLLQNLLKKINSKEQILTKKKIEESMTFFNRLVTEGFLFNDEILNNLMKINFSPIKIFEIIFKNKNQFIKKFEKIVLDNEAEFEKNELLYNETNEIIEKFDREYGLSIDDFEKLNEVSNLIIF